MRGRGRRKSVRRRGGGIRCARIRCGLRIVVVGRVVHDRRRERRRHFAACALGGAVALALLTLHLPNLVAMMALLSIAAMLIFAAHPVFWAVPSAYFSGAGAAGAIALISSIGVSSGMITPWIVGVIRTKTGSMDPAMLMIAALLAACAVAMLIGVRAAPHGSADARGSAAV